mgnify:FL=1
MITLYTKRDIERCNLPSFICDTAYCLLDAYRANNLEKYGGVCWIESAEELAPYEAKTVEFAEIIITEGGKIWHGAFISNNDYATDIYVEDSIITSAIREEWQNNLIRTVDENEFQ